MKKLLLILISVSLVSCLTIEESKTYFELSLDAINSPESENLKNYILISGMDSINQNSLEFREIESYIDNALRLKGFTKQTDPNLADIALLVAYGVEGPITSNFSVDIPTWGQTGYSSTNTKGSMSTFGNYSYYNEKTTYTPTYGITGSQNISGTYNTYFRYLYLNALNLIEYKEKGTTSEVWKITINSNGRSNDKRYVYPALIAATYRYFGSRTNQQLTIRISDDDERIILIKNQ